MTNALICALNRAAEGSILSVTSESGELVADNMLNQQPSIKWAATSSAQQVITGTLDDASPPELRRISAVAFGRHNFYPSGTVRLELFDDAALSSSVFDQTWNVNEPTFGYYEGTWDDYLSTWDGYSDQDAILGLDTFIRTFDEVLASHYRITLDSLPEAASAGVLFLGRQFQPRPFNIDRDPSINMIDPSQLTETRGGALRSEAREPYREASINWSMVDSIDTTDFRTIIRDAGKRKLCIVSIYPDRGDNLEVDGAFIGRLVDWSVIQRRPEFKDEYHSIGITIREAI